ncbi:MAG: PDZ domain-containing protein [Nitriliruptorales bacterium]|nr:PDZ domain-containing protein [Nitriliruptorales bacterium]
MSEDLRTDPASGWPTAYPAIPSGARSADGDGTAGRGHGPWRQLAGVALGAAIAGSLLGGALLLGVLTWRGVLQLQGAVTGPALEVSSPTIEVNGGEDLDRVAGVARAVLPSVVQVDIDGGDSAFGTGNGSGVVYRSDGYIITNNHVVSRADGVTVVFADGSEADAEVVGTDRETDLAVLRVDRTGMPAISVGDSSDLQAGELAVAIGSPFGLDGSVTAGVVSAVNRGPISVRGPDGERVSLYDVIQTDAPINPGNSGGPLVSGQGRLIGINSAILTGGRTPGNAGVGFAIPVGIAVETVDELISSGEVRYAFLGVQGMDVNPDVAERVGVDAGAHVDEVLSGPAEDAGLRPGDVVTDVDGALIDSMDALVMAIRQADVGDTVSVTYRRSGEDVTVEVTLTELPRP